MREMSRGAAVSFSKRSQCTRRMAFQGRPNWTTRFLWTALEGHPAKKHNLGAAACVAGTGLMPQLRSSHAVVADQPWVGTQGDHLTPLRGSRTRNINPFTSGIRTAAEKKMPVLQHGHVLTAVRLLSSGEY